MQMDLIDLCNLPLGGIEKGVEETKKADNRQPGKNREKLDKKSAL